MFRITVLNIIDLFIVFLLYTLFEKYYKKNRVYIFYFSYSQKNCYILSIF